MASKKLFFLFSILLSMVGTKALAYDIKVKNADGEKFYYNYINDEKELAVTYSSEYSYNTYSGSVVIPEEVTYEGITRKVTSIGEKAFYKCHRLTSITIPNSVKTIGNNAFAECDELTSITIPNSVTSIGMSVFRQCNKLTSVTIGNSVTSIGASAFYFCESLTSITIPYGVTIIESSVFQGCSALTSITIPNGVTSIELCAFSGCSALTSVTTPNSVTSIGGAAFSGCSSLTFFTIPNSVTSIGSNAFKECSSLTSVTIPNGVKSIEAGAFDGCSALTSVFIPNSVTSIGWRAFCVCSSLTSVSIPNSVTTIGDDAFAYCESLTSIMIPSSVTSIGKGAFDGCDLTEVISKIENPFFIYTNTFSDNTYNNATLYIPSGTIDKYKATEGWKNFYIIEEESGNGENPPEPSKCEKPTITFKDGKLTFSCATEGVTYQYSITASDVKNGAGNDIDFAPVYTITAYATKDGYENSEIATLEVSLSDSSIGIKGDVNGDGSVNAADVVKLVNIIIGLK